MTNEKLIEEAAKIIVEEVEDEPMWSAVVIAKKIVAVFEKALGEATITPTDDEREALDRRIEDLRLSRDAVSGALAHEMHHRDPGMFFLAVRQLLNSVRFLVDGYAPNAEDANQAGGERR